MGTKIYHITHIDNLPGIVQSGFWSDARRLKSELDCKIVGINTIKKRRLTEYQIGCHPGTFVGEYVPFFFCPRSVMLYLLHKGNHVDLSYSGGQGPILHLQADLEDVVAWADSVGRKWAVSTGNAGAKYAQFDCSLAPLKHWNWDNINSTDFRDPVVKEAKQSEFLVHDSLPWKCIERVGVISSSMASRVQSVLADASHLPSVGIQLDWYY